MNILLIYELLPREILSLKVLARVLERRGHTVTIVGYPEANATIRKIQPDIVVNNTNRQKEHFYPYFYGLRHHDFKIVDLPWEQIIVPTIRWAFKYKDGFQQKYIDLRLAWGEGFKRHSVNEGLKAENVIVTGSPKQSLIPLMQAVIDKEAVKSVILGENHPHSKIVLVTCGFPGAFLEVNRHQGNPAAYNYLKFNIPWSKIYNALYIQLIKEIAPRYPEVLFLVRLHPGKFVELREMFGQNTKDSPNVFLNWEGDFNWLLLVADLVIATRSTALIDAYLAEIPALNLLDPEVDPYLTDPYSLMPFDLFGELVSKQDIINHLPQYLSGTYRYDLPRLAQIWLHDWINTQGWKCFDNIAAALEEVHQRPRRDWGRQFLYEHKWKIKRWREARFAHQRPPVDFHSYGFPGLDDLLLANLPDG
ncbi:MAG: hypothetical protein AB1491_04850 [Thermodesulfobacteriota bacterium]